MGRVLKMIEAQSRYYGFEYDGCFESPFTLGERRVNAYTWTKIEHSPEEEHWVYEPGVDPLVADAIFNEIRPK